MLVKRNHTHIDTKSKAEIHIQGSKHSFSRIFPSFLQFNTGCLKNVPIIKDVEIQIDAMKMLGFDLYLDEVNNALINNGTCQKSHDNPSICDFSSKYSRSLINLYPIFSRYGVELAQPTGCPIGKRDISWYVEIMEHFGIKVKKTDMITRVYRSQLKDVGEVKIRNRSFSSTNIAIACAVESRSDTKVIGPSLEPEIFDLIYMLKSGNVRIDYNSEEDYVHINANEFDETCYIEHAIMPDRNVIVTFICGGLLLKKDVEIRMPDFNEKQLQMDPFFDILRDLDIEYFASHDGLVVMGSKCNLENKHLDIKAGHFPLFCSDWQPLIAVLAKSGLTLTIEDTLFESRFGYLEEYKKFGIDFNMFTDRYAKIYRSTESSTDPQAPIRATARDLRCGAGIALLSMLHNGICEIDNSLQIMRGYEGYDRQLNALLGQEAFAYISN